MRSVTAKTMYEVTNNMSITRDQLIYMACAGVLAFSSFEWPKKCSVDQENLDNIKNKKKDKKMTKIKMIKQMMSAWKQMMMMILIQQIMMV